VSTVNNALEGKEHIMAGKQINSHEPDNKSQLSVAAAYSQALDHFNAKRYNEADKLCTAIIQKAPNHIDAINLLGVIAQKVNRHDLAIEQFQRAINIDNNKALLYYNLGGSLCHLGRREEAIHTLQIALKKEPGNSQIADYLRGITKPPLPNAEEALQKGVSSHQAGQLDEAIHWYKKALQINSKNAVALSNMGFALQTTGKIEEAVASYQKAIAIKPDYAEAHSNLGNAMKKQGKMKEAATSYQKAIAIKPGHAKSHFNLGVALQEQGKLDEAVASYQKAIAIKPDYADAYSNLGNTIQEQGKLEEAITNYQKAISVKPGLAAAHSNLGNALQEQGKLEEAVTSYQKAISIKPDYANAYSNLGNTLQKQGKLEEAVACHQKAMSIEPDSSSLKSNLRTIKNIIVEDYIINLGNDDQIRSLDALLPISKDAIDGRLKVNLLYCPFVDPITPPMGIASLKGYLEKYSNTQVHCVDLNSKWHTMIAATSAKAAVDPIGNGDRLFRNSDNMFDDIDQYRNVSEKFIGTLQETHLSVQYSLCQDDLQLKNNVISYLKPLALYGSPDVIGFSILLDSQILCSLLLAKEIKQKYPEKIVVFGGAAMLSSFKKIIRNPFVDFVISDAGEASFNELLNSISEGKFNKEIPGVAYKTTDGHVKNNAVPSNLDHDAYPDFSDIDLNKYFTQDVVIPILSSKGCFWRRCSFCEEGSINMYAVASVDRVVDEIEHHYSKGHCYFQFIDEMISPKRLRMLSNEIIKRDLKVFFYATLRPSSDYNEETVQLMHRAGFRYIIWGVESCNPRVLKLVNKGTTVETIRNTLKISKNAGIRNHIFVMIGFPTETPDELFDTMQFIYDNIENIHCIHSGPFLLGMGTEIYLNPEQFGIDIKHSKNNPLEYRAIHKSGTTGKKSNLYFLHYLETFIKKIPIVYEFAFLRDHAILYYAKFPIDELEDVRKRVPKPIPAQIY
jgi:anaerobic magnesium-protoporphyrin IX monomethyl ester cyclase